MARMEDSGRAGTLLEGENQILEMLVKGAPLANILSELCVLAEKVSPEWVTLWLLADGASGDPAIFPSPSLPHSFLSRREDWASQLFGPLSSTCSQERTLVRDISSAQDLPIPFKKLASEHGYISTLSSSVLRPDETNLGVFMALSHTSLRLAETETLTINQLTHLAALALERTQTEDRLRRKETYLAEAQELSRTGSFSWCPSTRDLWCSEETYRIFGCDLSTKLTLDEVRNRLHPEDLAKFELEIERSAQGKKERSELDFRLVLPSGELKFVTMICHAPKATHGSPPEYIGAIQDVTRQRIAEQTLQIAVDTIPGLVWSAEPDGYIDFLNERWLSYTGMSPADACGWGWRAAIHPEDAKGLEAYWRSVLDSGEPGEYEARLRRYDGIYRWFLFRGVPYRDSKGGITKWYGQTTDIDGRKQAEERLRRSEAYLAEAQKLSQTGSFAWISATKELVWSTEIYNILDLPPHLSPSLDLVLERVHPEDLHKVHHLLGPGLRERRNLDFEHRLQTPSGDIKYVRVIAQLVHSSEGREEIVGAVMDVTERKLAAEALSNSERLARYQTEALAETVDELAKQSAPEHIVEYVVRTVTRQLDSYICSVWLRDLENESRMQFQFSLEDGDFQTASEALPAYSCPQLGLVTDWPWSEIFRSKQSFILNDIHDSQEGPLKDHLVSKGIVTCLVVPMHVAGEVAGVIGILFTRPRQFSVEEMALAQALANQAMLAIQLARLTQQSRQAAVIAERNRLARDIHDTLAQGFTGIVVQLEAASDARSRGLTQDAEAHQERARNLARESLKEARRSVRALRPQILDGKTLCEALEELTQTMTDGTALHSSFHFEGRNRLLPPDWEENLVRICQEVLANTLRHAQATQFEVELDLGTDTVSLRMKDNGRGFDPEQRGGGFGLVGIRERAHQMGGRLEVQSAPGKGTRISISISFPEIQSTL